MGGYSSATDGLLYIWKDNQWTEIAAAGHRWIGSSKIIINGEVCQFTSYPCKISIKKDSQHVVNILCYAVGLPYFISPTRQVEVLMQYLNSLPVSHLSQVYDFSRGVTFLVESEDIIWEVLTLNTRNGNCCPLISLLYLDFLQLIGFVYSHKGLWYVTFWIGWLHVYHVSPPSLVIERS